MVIDPIGDMLNRIKNAGLVGRSSIIVSFSDVKMRIGNILVREGYVGAVAKKTRKGLPVLEITLAYAGKTPKVQETLRISKPSRRIYSPHDKLGVHHRNLGVLLLSTPKGILTHVEARKEHVGGEVLLRVW
jgi:small subunit ribosomal protein S8